MDEQDRDVLFRVGVAAHPETSAALEELGREVLATQAQIQQSMAAVAENAIQQIRRVRAEASAPTGFVPAPVAMPAGRSVDVSPTVMTSVGSTATEAKQQIGSQLFGHADTLVDASRRAIGEIRESVRAMREIEVSLLAAVKELHAGVVSLRDGIPGTGSRTPGLSTPSAPTKPAPATVRAPSPAREADRAARQRRADQEFVNRYQRSQAIKTVQRYDTAKRQSQTFRRMERVYGQRSRSMFRGAFRGGVQIARGLGLASLSEKEGSDAQKLLQDLMKLQSVVDVVMGAHRVFETVGKGFEFMARKDEMSKRASAAEKAERELAPEADAARRTLKEVGQSAASETLNRIKAIGVAPISSKPSESISAAVATAVKTVLGAEGQDGDQETEDLIRGVKNAVLSRPGPIGRPAAKTSTGTTVEDLIRGVGEYSVEELTNVSWFKKRASKGEIDSAKLTNQDEIVDAELADQATEKVKDAAGELQQTIIGKVSSSLMSGAGALAGKLGLAGGVGTASIGTLVGSGLGAVAGVGAAGLSAYLTGQETAKYGLGGGAEHGSLVDKVATWEVETGGALARVLDKVGIDFSELGYAIDSINPAKAVFSLGELAKAIEKVNETAEMTGRLTERLQNSLTEQAHDAKLVAIESGERRQMAGAEDRARGMRRQWEDILRPTPDYAGQLQQFDWEASQRDYERRRAIRFREPGAMTEAEADRASLEDRMKHIDLQEQQRQERMEPQRERAQQELKEASERKKKAEERVKAIEDNKPGIQENTRTPEQIAASEQRIADLERQIAERKQVDRAGNIGKAAKFFSGGAALRLAKWGKRTIFGGEETADVGAEGEGPTVEELERQLKAERTGGGMTDLRPAWQEELNEANKDLVKAREEELQKAQEVYKVSKMDREEARAHFRVKLDAAQKEIEKAQEKADIAKQEREAELERIGGMHDSQRAELSTLMDKFNEAGDKGLSEEQRDRFYALRKKFEEKGAKGMTAEERKEAQDLDVLRAQAASENVPEHILEAVGKLTNDATVQDALSRHRKETGKPFEQQGIGFRKAMAGEDYQANAEAGKTAREDIEREQRIDEFRRDTLDTEAVGQALGPATEQQLKARLENPKFQVTLDADIDNTAKQVANQVMVLIMDYEKNLKTLVAEEVKKQKTDLATQNNQGAGGRRAGQGTNN